MRTLMIALVVFVRWRVCWSVCFELFCAAWRDLQRAHQLPNGGCPNLEWWRNTYLPPNGRKQPKKSRRGRNLAQTVLLCQKKSRLRRNSLCYHLIAQSAPHYQLGRCDVSPAGPLYFSWVSGVVSRRDVVVRKEEKAEFFHNFFTVPQEIPCHRLAR